MTKFKYHFTRLDKETLQIEHEGYEPLILNLPQHMQTMNDKQIKIWLLKAIEGKEDDTK